MPHCAEQVSAVSRAKRHNRLISVYWLLKGVVWQARAKSNVRCIGHRVQVKRKKRPRKKNGKSAKRNGDGKTLWYGPFPFQSIFSLGKRSSQGPQIRVGVNPEQTKNDPFSNARLQVNNVWHDGGKRTTLPCRNNGAHPRTSDACITVASRPHFTSFCLPAREKVNHTDGIQGGLTLYKCLKIEIVRPLQERRRLVQCPSILACITITPAS